MPKSEEDWRKTLTTKQYHVLRQHGTEPPRSSPRDKSPKFEPEP